MELLHSYRSDCVQGDTSAFEKYSAHTLKVLLLVTQFTHRPMGKSPQDPLKLLS